MCSIFQHLIDIDEASQFSLSEHKYGTDDTNRKVEREESAVVEEGIEIFAHSLGCPLSPDGNTGDKVADETEKYHSYNTEVYVDLGIPCELHLVEDAGKAEDGEGHNVVKENAQNESARCLTVGEDVAASHRLHQLGERIDEAGGKSRSDTVLYADKHNGQHACYGDGAAHRHLEELSTTEGKGECEHYRALTQGG